MIKYLQICTFIIGFVIMLCLHIALNCNSYFERLNEFMYTSEHSIHSASRSTIHRSASAATEGCL